MCVCLLLCHNVYLLIDPLIQHFSYHISLHHNYSTPSQNIALVIVVNVSTYSVLKLYWQVLQSIVVTLTTAQAELFPLACKHREAIEQPDHCV